MLGFLISSLSLLLITQKACCAFAASDSSFSYLHPNPSYLNNQEDVKKVQFIVSNQQQQQQQQQQDGEHEQQYLDESRTQHQSSNKKQYEMAGYSVEEKSPNMNHLDTIFHHKVNNLQQGKTRLSGIRLLPFRVFKHPPVTPIPKDYQVKTIQIKIIQIAAEHLPKQVYAHVTVTTNGKYKKFALNTRTIDGLWDNLHARLKDQNQFSFNGLTKRQDDDETAEKRQDDDSDNDERKKTSGEMVSDLIEESKEQEQRATTEASD